MNARRRSTGLVLALAMLITACASTPDERADRPGWIDRPGEDYPADLYVVGLGEGANAERARNRARADLAKAFEVEVRAESLDIEEFGRIGPAASEQGQLSTRVEREIRTRTDVVLAGVDIAESWHDAEDDVHYALAVINRPRAASRLRDEIRQLDRTTDRHIDEAVAAEDPLRRLRALDQAIDAQVRREALNRQLRVVGPGGRGIDAPTPLAEVAAQYRRSASAIRLATRTEGLAREDIGPALAAAVTDAGFGSASDGADYEVVLQLDFDDIGKRSDWYWYRGYLHLVVQDAQGQVHASDRWAVRASATDRATAWRRTVDEAASGLDSRLHAALLEGRE